jgi:hypothetical protein
LPTIEKFPGDYVETNDTTFERPEDSRVEGENTTFFIPGGTIAAMASYLNHTSYDEWQSAHAVLRNRLTVRRTRSKVLGLQGQRINTVAVEPETPCSGVVSIVQIDYSDAFDAPDSYTLHYI